jgi:hypothetical protein
MLKIDNNNIQKRYDLITTMLQGYKDKQGREIQEGFYFVNNYNITDLRYIFPKGREGTQIAWMIGYSSGSSIQLDPGSSEFFQELKTIV